MEHMDLANFFVSGMYIVFQKLNRFLGLTMVSFTIY